MRVQATLLTNRYVISLLILICVCSDDCYACFSVQLFSIVVMVRKRQIAFPSGKEFNDFNKRRALQRNVADFL